MAIEPEEPVTVSQKLCTRRTPQLSRLNLRYYTETDLLA
jgi:hypothetical protein